MNLIVKKTCVLDFDIENRPLSYLGQDFTTSDITGIGWSFVGSRQVHSLVLGDVTTEEMLRHFVVQYDQADVVTGHYILMHDLPIINAMLIEATLPPLQQKLVSDTKVHLIGFKGVSKSQESLSEMFGIPEPKIHMNTPRWREANRLTEEGRVLTRQRVEGDVRQHMALRKILLARNLLKPPTLWPLS